MQHAVHNRATIRVADRTDVSGRLNADKVNLDRFYNRIRKVCALVGARSKVYLSAATMILIVTLAAPASAQKQVHFRGSIQGNEFDIPQGGSIIQDKGSTTGIATYLGQFSFNYEGTANTATGMGAEGSGYLSTANGDSISTKA